MVDNILKDEGH